MGENTKKYHIDDEGNVVRFNADGSFTKMGNVETTNPVKEEDDPNVVPPPYIPHTVVNKPYSNNRRISGSLIFALLCIVVVLVALAIFTIFNSHASNTIETQLTNEEVAEEVVEVEPQVKSDGYEEDEYDQEAAEAVAEVDPQAKSNGYEEDEYDQEAAEADALYWVNASNVN